MSLWLGRSCNQSQRLAHFGVELRHGVFVVFEELAGVLTALANALALIAEPRPRFFENVVVHRDIQQVAFARNAFAIENVELGFAERRRHFVLHYFYPRARTGAYIPVLTGRYPPNVAAP